MTEPRKQVVYYVALFTINLKDIEEAKARAPEALAAHLARSRKLHEEGPLLLAGAFLHEPDQPLSTMAVLTSREAAEEYARGDPFVQNGMVTEWSVREWANMFA